jgi:argininosuccinate lyase
LTELSVADYQRLSSAFGDDVLSVLDLQRSMAARKATGAPAPGNVATQLERWQTRLAEA